MQPKRSKTRSALQKQIDSRRYNPKDNTKDSSDYQLSRIIVKQHEPKQRDTRYNH